MPRSFLLRRSLDSEENARKGMKTVIKGPKKSVVLHDDAKTAQGFNESYGQKNSRWPKVQNKMDTRGSYTYQSYIDGDMLEKINNNFKTPPFFKSLPGKDEMLESQLTILKMEAAKPELGTAESKETPIASGAKPIYRCDQCGKTFKTKYTLTIHLKMPSQTHFSSQQDLVHHEQFLLIDNQSNNRSQ